MANLFDNLQKLTHDVTLAVMGFDATWLPTATPEGEPLQARVHFKDPNEKMALSGVEYTPLAPFIEYRETTFPGLYEAARNNSGEVVTVNGIQYHVRDAERMFDGRTIKAYLEPVA